jgi:putative hydrolase of the HAD superfamily
MIENIIFDLGHVIIDIEFDRTIQAFRSLGKSDFHVALDTTNPIFNQFEVGHISADEFVQYWTSQIEGSTEEQIVEAWNALLIGIKPEVLAILKHLAKSYGLYVYSNTNSIHIDWVMNYLSKTYELNNWVPSIFKAAYYSHELGYRKPDKEGFIKILQEQNLEASNTLFIDDHLPNIHTANALGIQTIHKLPSNLLSDVLKQNNIYS